MGEGLMDSLNKILETELRLATRRARENGRLVVRPIDAKPEDNGEPK